jgi:hypothetical protein
MVLPCVGNGNFTCLNDSRAVNLEAATQAFLDSQPSARICSDANMSVNATCHLASVETAPA